MSSTTIAGNMIFGLILVLLWIPSIVIAETNNKGNRLETEKLNETLKTSFLYTGNIKKLNENKINLKTNFGNVIVNDSIYAREGYKVWTKTNITKNDSHGNSYTEVKYDWSPEIDGVNQYNDFKVGNDKGNDIIIDKEIDNYELKKISKITKENNMDIELDTNYKIEENNIVPIKDIKENYIDKQTKKGTIYNIPLNTEVTIFAKNDKLEKVDDETTSFIYPGKKTKFSIMEDRKTSNSMQKWIFRIVTFLVLFIGLNLLVSPFRYIIEETPEAFNLPILKIFKPILTSFGSIVLFFWDTFSFFGSLILTGFFTFIIYLLVNYALYGGISLGVFIIILFVMHFSKKN